MSPRHSRLIAPALAAALTVVGLAACGSSGSTSSSSSAAAASAGTSSSAAMAAATVQLRSSKLGRILTDATGRTLYLWLADKGGKSACTGACAGAWPPLVSHGAPHAGTGVTAGKLGTVKRAGGALQVTYAGHPLYTFSGDSAAGQVNGQGSTAFGAAWYAVSAGGSAIKSAHAPAASTSSSSGGYGGGGY